ncbi:hypothetical protein COLO4_20672 [Corchorus olitorius]|uniref:Uncharacterized protein n=1 Tax=Corchorus olitorius TaxID=93759 RepID=A0A1R3IXR6_9ROSI|nr:hypothetical protein COLO4_20672 [Corchorus olitorius]
MPFGVLVLLAVCVSAVFFFFFKFTVSFNSVDYESACLGQVFAGASRGADSDCVLDSGGFHLVLCIRDDWHKKQSLYPQLISNRSANEGNWRCIDLIADEESRVTGLNIGFVLLVYSGKCAGLSDPITNRPKLIDQGSWDYGYREGGNDSDGTLMTMTSSITEIHEKEISGYALALDMTAMATQSVAKCLLQPHRIEGRKNAHRLNHLLL